MAIIRPIADRLKIDPEKVSQELDLILLRLEQGMEAERIATEVGTGEAAVHYVNQLLARSELMRAPPLSPTLEPYSAKGDQK